MRSGLIPVVLVALFLTACAAWPPLIARNLPAGADRGVSFDKRVKERFPVGSDEEKMLTELRHEAFTIAQITTDSPRYQFAATYEAHDLACRLIWTVYWSSGNSRITNIAGDYSSICS
jgi:hypothetical protein